MAVPVTVDDLGIPTSHGCVASMVPRCKDYGGSTPGTTTPPPRSTSPSSDGFSHRWDNTLAPALDQPINTSSNVANVKPIWNSVTYEFSGQDDCTSEMQYAAFASPWALVPCDGSNATILHCEGLKQQPLVHCDNSPTTAQLINRENLVNTGLLPPGENQEAHCNLEQPQLDHATIPLDPNMVLNDGVMQVPDVFPAMMYLQFPAAPCSVSDMSDRHIIEGLAASESRHQGLLRIARQARSLLLGPRSAPVAQCVELYGSLALFGAKAPNCDQSWWQDWARHYVRSNSDVDLVVLLNQGFKPEDALRRLTTRCPFHLVNQTDLRKFATTQYTLLGLPDIDDPQRSPEVWVDLTCIDSPRELAHFKGRQEAFKQAFKSVRGQLAQRYGADGALAFDSYVYLLKGFSAQVPGNSLTGFQATCLGIFVLQLRLYEMKCCTMSGLVLFECFLRFCCVFFSDASPTDLRRLRTYRYCAIDLSLGGRLLPRLSNKWRTEVYFLGTEVRMQTKFSERLNVTHSVDPAAVHRAAQETLAKSCSIVDGKCVWT